MTLVQKFIESLRCNGYTEDSPGRWSKFGGNKEKHFTFKGAKVEVLEIEHPLREGWARWSFKPTKKNLAKLSIGL